MSTLIWITWIMMTLVFLKSMLIGGEFSLYYLFRYGKRYWDWYKNRPTFKP